MTYEEKFQTFIRMCSDTKEQGAGAVLISQPEILGDTYAEMVESLHRLSEADLMLRIVPRQERNPRSARWPS
jgi:hypothetical protein